ncbi:MAG: hypothetical protein QME12_01805 [Nanoarchaeota archaeon]|nr:hypothetical protein [Nanoarchaeota archaeon]
MRKLLIAILCAVILLASIAAAQVALPAKTVKAADLQIARNVAPVSGQVQVFNGIGQIADKSQCVCSADTLAKIAQIKKLLAELEQSCSAGVPSVEPWQPSGNCVDKCMAEQGKPYCENACVTGRGVGQLDSEGKVIQRDEECLAGCTASMKQKCWNSCNMPKPVEEGTGCIDTCMAKNYDKAGCFAGCSEEDLTFEGPCSKACQDKANEVYGMCEQQCAKQETTTAPTQGNELLIQCTQSCELKYSDCKQNCYASLGSDVPKFNRCIEQQCMPLLKDCSASCNSQYASKPTIVQKVVNVFRAAQYRNAKWICHDGTESVEGGDTSCKPSDTWSSYAKQACEGKCSAETNKCGVNTFMVYSEC